MRLEQSNVIGSHPIRSGFTLIELLVAIAGISVLLAVMLPALQTARRQSYKVACSSNLRNIAIAWKSYLADNNDRFYQARNANRDFGGWRGTSGGALSRPLNHYLNLPTKGATREEAKVFCCPADNGDQDYGSMAYQCHGNSYQTNLLLIGSGTLQVYGLPEPASALYREINAKLPGLSATAVSPSAEILLTGDYNWVTRWDPGIPPGIGGWSWHGREGYYNMAFLDCHVDFVEIRKGIYIDFDVPYRVQPFEEMTDFTLEKQEEIVRGVCGGS